MSRFLQTYLSSFFFHSKILSHVRDQNQIVLELNIFRWSNMTNFIAVWVAVFGWLEVWDFDQHFRNQGKDVVPSKEQIFFNLISSGYQWMLYPIFPYGMYLLQRVGIYWDVEVKNKWFIRFLSNNQIFEQYPLNTVNFKNYFNKL